MELLNNSLNQFLITNIISLLIGGLSVWLAIHRPADIPLTCETLSHDSVSPYNQEIKELLAAIHVAPDDSRVARLSSLTLQLSNSGKVPITVTESNPLSIVYARSNDSRL